MLNAMSRMIDHGERIVTIEDAAELQLQQPHVVPLETGPPNLEGSGEITIRDLVKNALRMRPDRIILGEVRGAEALRHAAGDEHRPRRLDVHAPRQHAARCLARMENMVLMSSIDLPPQAIRTQIASAVDLIVQVRRMRDGVAPHHQHHRGHRHGRRDRHQQDLFTYQYQGERADGTLIGRHTCTNFRPRFVARAQYYGLADVLLEAMGCQLT